MVKLICFSMLAVLAAFSAQAQFFNPPDLYLSDCQPTPAIPGGGESYPGAGRIIPSNKLAIPAGKAVLAEGQVVTLSGRVLDSNCVPVADAMVEIWQTNARGQYVVATPAQRANPYPVFAGSGRAVTDNLGRFEFVTIFPGPYDARAPHIHLRVAHRDFPTFFTEMFFAGDRRNESDRELKRLKPAQREHLMARVEDSGGMVQGYFDITLRGRNKYRKF